MESCKTYTWQQPVPKDPFDKRQLRLLNSFTRKKETFISNDRKTIKWYCCGPTVYDVSHLGHARCYITFDIIRRILCGYFGYNVFFVVNITDIDDKIIKRARSKHLCDKFVDDLVAGLRGARVNKEEVLEQFREAIDNYKMRRQDEQDNDKRLLTDNIVKKSVVALDKFKNLYSSDSAFTEGELIQVLDVLRDVIADEQDSKYAQSVVDHQIFKDLTSKYEQEFHEDMARLNVLPPSTLTRVSEFIQETGAYIKKLEENGYAYRSGGSIYFDTDKFDSSEKHSYAKLVREAYGQKKDLDEGEGELFGSGGDKKKSSNDFALWKKSKPGEPYWQTQDFESGRPGWHIECSVMASKLLGENFDIHAGGHDLRFPHHDNEIAQAEAYYNTGKNWVNYFLHSGHLTISGCKMSKSLKNFITIRDALKDYTSRQIRFAFLAHGWAETLDYSPNTMNTALSYEKTFREFFLNTTDTLRRRVSRSSDDQSLAHNHQFEKWSDEDQKLNSDYLRSVNLVDSALCDNFDTRSVLNHLSCLVKECNKRTNINLELLNNIASYIKHILTIFGTEFNELDIKKVFSKSDELSSKIGSSVELEEVASKYVETLAQFRAEIRKISKGPDARQSINQILSLCDALRDQTLPHLGVRLEDRETGTVPYVVKFVDRDILARERAAIEKKEQEKKLKEETLRLERLKIQQQRDEKARLPPHEMFISQTDKYSVFDDTGMPTHDSAGKEISKSALKKLQRLYAEQESRYKKYLESQKNVS